jgi:arylformamidase
MSIATSAPEGPGARAADGGGWIDVSVTLRDGMVHWPDNPPVTIKRQLDISKGDAANVSMLSMGSHTGTHMDAPLHFVADGKGLDEMDFEATIGPARVIEISDPVAVSAAELEDQVIDAGDRILFKTRNSDRRWVDLPFDEDFVYVSAGAAAHLVERGVRLVGVDYLSVGGFKSDGVETHTELLEAEIWVIEGLDLSRVSAGEYELICLPLKILRSDGAPARAILRPR